MNLGLSNQLSVWKPQFGENQRKLQVWRCYVRSFRLQQSKLVNFNLVNPIILISASSYDLVEKASHYLGCEAFLTKPKNIFFNSLDDFKYKVAQILNSLSEEIVHYLTAWQYILDALSLQLMHENWYKQQMGKSFPYFVTPKKGQINQIVGVYIGDRMQGYNFIKHFFLLGFMAFREIFLLFVPLFQ